MEATRRNVLLLSISQGLLLTNNTVMIATNGLAGYALAPHKALATIPVTTYVVGAALVTMQISLLMKRLGRKAGFVLGVVLGIVGALICGAAAWINNFWLLCFGTFIVGGYFAAGQYYRFAAADSAAPDFKSTAISLVLAGGIVGGIIGPETSKIAIDAIEGHRFVGSYLVLPLFGLIALLVLRHLDIPPLPESARHDAGRPLRDILRQPAFIVAALAGMIGYGVMNLLMTSTPLAMGFCGHPYAAAASVISAHVIAMFGPSFFTGSLIHRFGVLNVMMAGVAAMFACVGIALSGQQVVHFWWSLVLLGVGWNFMYVGGTTLLTEAYRPAEKAKAQGANEILVFCTTATSSFASGVLVNAAGWNTLNYVALPFLAIAGSAALWLALKRRAAAAAA